MQILAYSHILKTIQVRVHTIHLQGLLVLAGNIINILRSCCCCWIKKGPFLPPFTNQGHEHLDCPYPGPIRVHSFLSSEKKCHENVDCGITNGSFLPEGGS